MKTTTRQILKPDAITESRPSNPQKAENGMTQMERVIKYWQENSNIKAVQLLQMKLTRIGALHKIGFLCQYTKSVFARSQYWTKIQPSSAKYPNQIESVIVLSNFKLIICQK